jgi:NADH-quinone oxidoreductase subunit A
MKYFQLKIISKNKESLNHFYEHLFFRTDLNRNFAFLQKFFKFSNTKKRLTILKAPHVYKTAQEQFEINNFQRPFNVKFCVVAVLFIVFDIEIMFLVLWCVSVAKLNLLSYWSMMDFLIELIIGLFYVWTSGALGWEDLIFFI